MIILLSPAKSLDFETSVKTKHATTPQFIPQAAKLMKTLRTQSADDLSRLMKLSDALSELNFDRNQQWKKKHDGPESKPAVFAFQGDVYQGLEAHKFSAAELKRCQKHVKILSGLYGVLRPLDLMQPYRLEMGTRLKNEGGKNLYDFWGGTITDALNADLESLNSKLVVNLASNEYSKVAKLKKLNANVISPAFRDWKNGKYKMISFFAKRARGLMTRYAITNSIKTADGLKGFDLDGYSYNDELSKPSEPVFTRKQAS